MLAINRGLDDGKLYSTPPSSLSPNPYKRRGFLRRKGPPPTRKLDLSGNSSGRAATGTRPRPLRTPSDNLFRGPADTDVYMTPGDGHVTETTRARGSPLRNSRRGSPASSRSASPHKRPWYPAGCRPSSRESGRSSRGGHDNTYVVHPTFRHLFDETAKGGDAGGARGQNDGGFGVGVDGTGRELRQRGKAVPGAGIMGGSSCSSPQTATTVPQRSETGRKVRSATGERRREGANAYLSTNQNNLPGKQRRDQPARSGQTHNNDQMPRRKVTGEGKYAADKREGVQDDGHREPVVTVRDHVRDLQSRDNRRSQENGLSADGRKRVDPVSLSSAVFIGHSEQVLALAQHKDVMFSAAADGTAKAWDTYSQQCLATYEGHRKAVWGMKVLNRTLITGSADGTVRFWDIKTAQPLHVIDLHSAVRDVVVVGGFLAVATGNPGIEVIDLNCMRPHGTLKGHIMAVSALASLEGDTRLVSGSHDTFIRVWDPDTGNCEAVLSGHGGTIGALCTISWRSPAAVFGGAHRGGETETSGESVIISGSGDSTVRVWGRDGSGSNLGEWACRAVLEGHRHGVWAVHGFSLSGVFATGGGDATVKIWAPDTSTGEVNGTDVMDGGDETASEQHQPCKRWECVGGVRGAAGAVGAVLMNEEALVFGTSEALIARFPLQLCMPKRRPT